jgi:hypothetical protein
MLSAQTNSLGRRYAAAPITDWFNPSTYRAPQFVQMRSGLLRAFVVSAQ